MNTLARPLRWLRTLAALCLILSPAAARSVEWISGPVRKGGKLGAATGVSISSDGRYVAFATRGQLVAADTNIISDVYVRDRQTGEIRLVSDDRGGDQPVINATGRYVAFRSLDQFPKIRFADLDGNDAPRTISYPFGGGRSFRYADSAAISPSGQFVAFSFRPIPGFSSSSDPQLCVNNTQEEDRLNDGSESITGDFFLASLGRTAMTADGNTFFFETNDPLVGFDTNGTTDIYRATRGSTFVVRLSATGGGLPEEGAARHPVVSADGSKVFFISDRQLTGADDDGRATIYRSTSADGFATPQPILTSVQPIALSHQATSDGEYVVFLGKPRTGAARPYLLRVSSGQVTALATSATGAPVISADNGSIAFATNAPLKHSDTNGGPDIYVVDNPDEDVRIPAPVVTLSSPADGAVVDSGVGVLTTAAAAPQGGPGITSIALEVDGKGFANQSSSPISRLIAYAHGAHTVQAVAFNAAGVAARSQMVTIFARPAANTLGVRPLTQLSSSLNSDGTTSFSGTLRVDNRFAATRGALQIVLTETPDAARWEFFGDEFSVPERTESLLQVIEVPALAGNTAATVDIAGIVSPPETIGDGFQGVGWTVTARLREFVSGNWIDRDEAIILQQTPRLDEETPGPNGGVPQIGFEGGEGFNPALLQSLIIQGPNKLGEGLRAQLRGVAVFSTGNKAVSPVWSITKGGAFATVSTGGLLKAKAVAVPQSVTVRASFFGLTQTRQIVVNPRTPKISVSAPKATRTVAENGAAAKFRVLRSGPKDEAVTVTYQVGGTAIPGDDFVDLSGSVEIPAGVSAVNIDVTPFNDGFFEGNRTVTLTVDPSPDYRLGGASATVTIAEDEPFPPGHPDAVIQVKGGKPIGEFQIAFQSEVQQAATRKGIGQKAIFFYTVANRSDAAQAYRITGGGDFLGFSVRYFQGSTDVTAAVVDGTFDTESVAAGSSTRLKVVITPGKETPILSRIRCAIQATGNGFNDFVEAVVQRAR